MSYQLYSPQVANQKVNLLDPKLASAAHSVLVVTNKYVYHNLLSLYMNYTSCASFYKHPSLFV
jgi:hypothetical protein